MDNTTANIPLAVNNFYDRSLLDRVTAGWVHALWAQTRPLPRNQSTDTIKFRRYSNLAPATTPLVEGQNPVGVSLVLVDITATVAEYGNYVTISSTVDWTSTNADAMEWSDILSDNALDTLDILMSTVLNASTALEFAGSATNNGTVTSSDKVAIADIKAIVRSLKENNAKRITAFSPTDNATDVVNIKDAYVGIVHPRTTFDLKALTGFVDVEQYAHSTQLLPYEIGKVDEVRFVESTNAKVFTGEGDEGIDVYSTVVLGRNAYGRTMVDGETLRMVEQQPGGVSDPLGRIRTMGWYTTFVGKILNNAFMYNYRHATS